MVVSRPLISLCFSLAAAASVGASTVSCTAILSLDDAVQRCGSASDCDDTEDNRYVAECRFAPDTDVDGTQVDRICVATHTLIGCNPGQFAADHPFPTEMDAIGGDYEPCPDTGPAPRGCPATADGCGDGLVPRADSVCDVDAAPAVPAIYGDANLELSGQEVRDQFCRSFFCDESFVCDATFSCVQCDPEKPFGEGGCGVVYSGGAPACPYLAGDALRSACAGPDADKDDPKFGTCP